MGDKLTRINLKGFFNFYSLFVAMSLALEHTFYNQKMTGVRGVRLKSCLSSKV